MSTYDYVKCMMCFWYMERVAEWLMFCTVVL